MSSAGSSCHHIAIVKYMLIGLINLLLMFPKVVKVCDLPPKLKVSKQKGYVYAILITEDSVGKVMAKKPG